MVHRTCQHIAKTKGGMKMENYEFYKNKPEDSIYWVDDPDTMGEYLFSFDKKHVFNLFTDYPHKLTAEQREVFEKENPEWRDFFAGR